MTQKGSRLFRAICGKEESNLITSERENFTKKSQRAFGSLKKSSLAKQENELRFKDLAYS